MKRKAKSEKENKAKDLETAIDVILSLLMVQTALLAIDSRKVPVEEVFELRKGTTKEIIKVIKLLEKKNGKSKSNA